VRLREVRPARDPTPGAAAGGRNPRRPPDLEKETEALDEDGRGDARCRPEYEMEAPAGEGCRGRRGRRAGLVAIATHERSRVKRKVSAAESSALMFNFFP
jgi:hypothetical protein